MRRLLSLGVLSLAVASCSLFAPAEGEGEGEGAEGEGEGAEGEGEGELAIVGVDATGSALAVDGAVDGVNDGVNAAHRFRGEFVVSGAALDSVVAASLIDDAGAVTSLEIVPMPQSTTARFRVPTLASGGHFVLLLASLTSTARAEVFVLQGEPGPKTAVNVVDATADECPLGGRVFVSVADSNNDGVFGVDEAVNRSVQCDATIVKPQVVPVANADALRTLLATLSTHGIGAPLTIQLPTTLTLTAPLDVSHVDGRWLTLQGPCEVTLNGGNVGVTVTQVVNLVDVDFAVGAGATAGSTGLNVDPGAHATLTNPTFTGLAFGVFADSADVELIGAHFVDNAIGLNATRAARVTARNAVFEGGDDAIVANLGAWVNAFGLDADGVARCVVTTFGAVVEASGGRIRALTTAILASANASVRVVDTSVVGAATVVNISQLASVVVAVRPTTSGVTVAPPRADVSLGAFLSWEVAGAAGSADVSDNATVSVEDGTNCNPSTGGVCGAHL